MMVRRVLLLQEIRMLLVYTPSPACPGIRHRVREDHSFRGEQAASRQLPGVVIPTAGAVGVGGRRGCLDVASVLVHGHLSADLGDSVFFINVRIAVRQLTGGASFFLMLPYGGPEMPSLLLLGLPMPNEAALSLSVRVTAWTRCFALEAGSEASGHEA